MNDVYLVISPLFVKKFDFFMISIQPFTLCILVTPKCILWKMMIMRISSGSPLFAMAKTISDERSTKLFGNYIPSIYTMDHP